MRLQGYDLFKCSFCPDSFQSSADLKQHLHCCQKLNGDGKSFRCPHCPKSLKYLLTYIDHVKTHGTVRYCCSLCDFKHSNQLSVKMHMKTKHRVFNLKSTPLDETKGDHDKDIFIIKPVVKRKTSKNKSNHTKENFVVCEVKKEPLKTTFHPKEIEELPLPSIYSYEVHCALCEYKSKVKLNMVKHFHLHLENKLVSVRSPVNPVPYLEKKEKMSDKMMNMAASSHLGNMKKFATCDTSPRAEVFYPQFIPPSQRYICGFEGCYYLTIEENMLRQHLTTLHMQQKDYCCKHCYTPHNEYSINVENIIKHLRLHNYNLYKCGYCDYMHYNRYKIEKHCSVKHLATPFVHIIRELSPEKIPEKKERTMVPWKCGFCNRRYPSQDTVRKHIVEEHGISYRYKCAFCQFGSSFDVDFEEHFQRFHPGCVEDIMDVYYKVESKPKCLEPFCEDGSKAIWNHNTAHVKHIQGILSEPIEVPSKEIPCKSVLTFTCDEKTLQQSSIKQCQKAIENVLKSFENSDNKNASKNHRSEIGDSCNIPESLPSKKDSSHMVGGSENIDHKIFAVPKPLDDRKLKKLISAKVSKTKSYLNKKTCCYPHRFEKKQKCRIMKSFEKVFLKPTATENIPNNITAKPELPLLENNATLSNEAGENSTNLYNEEEEGFSYYGQKPEKINLNSIRADVELSGFSMNMRVQQLAKIYDLFPVVKVIDCVKNNVIKSDNSDANSNFSFASNSSETSFELDKITPTISTDLNESQYWF